MCAVTEEHAFEIIKDKSTWCLLLTLGRSNRAHVAEVLVLFGMVRELAVETVTLTTSVSVQSPSPLFVIVQLDSTVGTSMLSHMDELCLPLLVL